MATLVTGGAGYIGGVTVELLRKRGEDVVVLDDLSKGHREAVDADVPFYEGKTGDAALVRRIVEEHGVEACIHFAASIEAGESVTAPAWYFENNFVNTLALLAALREAGVDRLVFSSTAAVYGEPKQNPIPEEHPLWPANPYGWSKFMVERTLESFERAYGLKFVALRYFNAAGATERHGEDHHPETHLIPNVLRAAQGLQSHVKVFGQYYPTSDGTPVRDYVHVADLGAAHLLALDYLRDGGQPEFINLGNGKGYTVLDVIEAVRRVTGRDIEVRREPPRAGDPSHLVACADKARRVLGWTPAYPELEEIIKSAWEWRVKNPKGYGK